MEASKGKPIGRFLEKYHERYEHDAIGILCGIWLARMPHVGSFAKAVQGTVPDEDLALISVYESSANLQAGLLELGEHIRKLDAVRKSTIATLMMAAVVAIIWHLFIAIQAFWVIPKMSAAMKTSIDVTRLNTVSQLYFQCASIVQSWWWLWAIAITVLTVWVSWSLPNYTGRMRPWLDRNILFYQIYRDFHGASFLAALSAITRSSGAQVIQLSDALKKMDENAYPWLKWQIGRIRSNLENNPNGKGEIFNTGLMSQASYFRVLDIADYAQLSQMLTTVGEVILTNAPEEINKKSTKIRYFVMLIALLTMLAIYGGTFVMIEDFKHQVEFSSLYK